MRPEVLALCCAAIAVFPAATAVRVLPPSQRNAANDVFSSILDHHEHHQSGTENVNVSRSDTNFRQLASVEVPFPSTPDDHEVTSLPLLAEGEFTTKHWAGLLPASADGDKYFFYWLFAPDMASGGDELQEADIPLVIWLNGGPGCSSMDGLFLENGPLRFKLKENAGNAYELVAAQHSWHKTPAYMLYIDQPVGTGLSFTTSRKYPRNDQEVNTDFYAFLQSFLKAHGDKFVTEQRLNRPFYFSGESHAGHYIPSMMSFILDQNEKISNGGTGIYVPLSGAAIGNGWVDPFHQYSAAEAAYGHGIIDRAQVAALAKKEKECQAALNQKRYTSPVCFNLLDDVVGQSYGSKSNFKVSQYDIRQVESRKGSRNFPPGHKVVESYLGGHSGTGGMNTATMDAALAAIHATESRTAGQVYAECTNPPYDALSHQDGLGVVNEVVQVLEHEVEGEEKVRLLFFNGVTDLICNHVGNEILLEQLPWKNRVEWIESTRTAWKSISQQGDKISGYIKEFENLGLLKLLDSGHMVPMDQPQVALDMMRLFLFGGEGAFQYSPQRLDRSSDTDGQCPLCPECPTNMTNYDTDSSRSSIETSEDSDGPSKINIQIWIGVGLAAVVLVAIYAVHHRSKYGNRTAVAGYDLEMRGGTYFDDPDGTGVSKDAESFRER